MPHQQISMSPPEVADYLKEERRLILGTLAQDGAAWADAASFLLQGSTLFFRIPRSSRSFTNIQRDPRVCCVVDRYPSYPEIKGVIMHGRAQAVTEEKTVRRVLPLLEALDDPVQPGTALQGVLFAIGLEDVTSFDFSKIQQQQ